MHVVMHVWCFLPEFVGFFSFWPHLQNVSVGMRILGIVLEVSSKGLTVSLPQGMRGHVDPAQVSGSSAASPCQG